MLCMTRRCSGRFSWAWAADSQWRRWQHSSTRRSLETLGTLRGVGGFHRGRIRDRIIVNRSQFDEKLLSTIRSDPKKFDSLRSVAMVHSADPKALQQILSDVENTRNALGCYGVLAKQSAVMYDNLKQSSPL